MVHSRAPLFFTIGNSQLHSSSSFICHKVAKFSQDRDNFLDAASFLISPCKFVQNVDTVADSS